MTFRFNFSNFTQADAGKRLICVNAITSYFTEGKTYRIVIDGKTPAIRCDQGDILHHSSSEFEFYDRQDLTPKQPKVGEVWSLRSGEFYDSSLYVVERVDEDYVWNRHIKDGNIHREQKHYFVQDHIFVF